MNKLYGWLIQEILVKNIYECTKVKRGERKESPVKSGFLFFKFSEKPNREINERKYLILIGTRFLLSFFLEINKNVKKFFLPPLYKIVDSIPSIVKYTNLTIKEDCGFEERVICKLFTITDTMTRFLLVWLVFSSLFIALKYLIVTMIRKNKNQHWHKFSHFIQS